MGQKVNPIGLRVGINRSWDSRWFSEGSDYIKKFHEDIAIRKYIQDNIKNAGISKILIERPNQKARITVYTSKPGVIIGKKGNDIDNIKKDLGKLTGSEVSLNIVEVKRAETDAVLIGESIAQQIEKRVSFKKAMKKSVQSAMKLGALGIKVKCSGRLAGAEIARSEWYKEGRIPLHTLRADIDYTVAEAKTPYGVIGIKVWVFKGEVTKKEFSV